MTATTSPGETSAITTNVNTLSNSNIDVNSAMRRLGDINALRRSYDGMIADQRQAMARDDVPLLLRNNEGGTPASLRRRLSGPVPYAEQVRPIAAEEEEPLPALIGEDEEEAPMADNDYDVEQESDGFTVYITMSDGFLAAITLSGRSVEAGSLNKMTLQDRVAFVLLTRRNGTPFWVPELFGFSHQRRAMRSAGANQIELLLLV